jgi:hypothetical protein
MYVTGQSRSQKWKFRFRGENNMERFAKLMVLSLGIGVVAVVLGFPPRHTFAAEGTTSKSLITLIATGSNAYSTTPYFYQFNPTTRLYSTTAYALPTGKSLILTDIVTTVGGCPAGSLISDDLYSTSSGGTAPGARVYGTAFTVNSGGFQTVADHFTTGFVLTGPNFPVAAASSLECGSLTMTVEGAEVSGSPTVGPFQ